ncbi:MAG: hypothetical protein AB7O62_24920 [Pirellulales bacterium]
MHRELAVAIRCLAAALVVLFAVSRPSRGDESFRKQTFVYKTVEKTKIEIDVYREDDDQVRHPVVWIHGGALIVGTKDNPPQRLAEFCAEQGYALVSID